MIKINQAKEFIKWINSLTLKEQSQVNARLEKIEKLDYFGDAKHIGNGLIELRWKNGWRVYFIKESYNSIILLIGGTKNDQKKDIQRAKILIERYCE